MEKLNTNKTIKSFDKTKKILFLLDKPEEPSDKTDIFTINDYPILKNLLDELPTEITSNITFGFLSPHPSFKNDTIDNKTLYGLFIQNINKELLENPPETIIALGTQVAYCLGIENKTIIELRTLKEKYKTSNLFFTYSYSYLKYVNADSKGKKYFDSTLNDIKSHLGVLKREDSQELNYEILHYNDIEKLIELYQNDTHIVFDYETQGLDVKLPYFYVGSVGFYGLQSKKSVYLSLYSLERLHTKQNQEEQDKKVKTILHNFFSDETKTFICFNCTYEFQVTAICYDYKFKKLEDVLQLARTLGYSGSLKEQASSKLDILKWNDQVNEWIDLVNKLLSKTEKVLNSKKTKDNVRENVLNILNNSEKYTFKDLKEACLDLEEHTVNLQVLIKSFYLTKEEVLDCESKTINLLDFLLKTKTECNFTQLPEEILGNYCIYDVLNTYKLYELYLKELEELQIPKETLNIFYNQGLLACELNLNGTFWDEEQALKLEKHYIETATQNLRKFILSDLFKKVYFEKEFEEKLEEAVKNFKGDTFNYQQTKNILDLPVDFPKIEKRTDFSQIEYIKIKTSDLEVLKEYYNPNSNKKESIKLFSDTIMTQRIKLARLMFEVWTLVNGGKNKEEDFPNLNSFSQRFDGLEQKILSFTMEKELFLIDNLIKEKKENFACFELYENKDFLNFIKTQDNMIEVLNNCINREFEIKYLKLLQSEAFKILEELKKFLQEKLNILNHKEKKLVFFYLNKNYVIDGCNSETMTTLYKMFQFICKVNTNELVNTKDTNNLKEYKENTLTKKEIEKALNLDLELENLEEVQDLSNRDIVIDNEIERDMDKKISWIQEFKSLLYIRSYKKILKNYTACIKGKMGREQVLIVDKEEAKNKIYRAKAWYSEREIDSETECYMKNYQYIPNSAETKRFKCLVGNSKILMKDGTEKEISCIKKGEYVVSFNIEKKCFEFKEVLQSMQTGVNKKVIEIELENNKSIKCTPEHLFLTEDKNGYFIYKEAKDLTIEDNIVDFYEY